jgi:uncharacterized protein YcfJ
MRLLGRLSLLALIALSACATVPSGPSHLVLPGSRKSFDQFRADDAMCRQYAHDQVAGVTPEQAGVDSGVKSAVIGTAVGAAAGALIGGGRGAGIGAGAGLLVGSAAGAGAAAESSYGSQHRYDFSYEQCMYAQGHKVPVHGRFASSRPRSTYAPPPPPPNYPPPPPR